MSEKELNKRSYSRLLRVRIENFMGYENGVIEFDDGNNVINIKGKNSTGKSAFQRAMVVLFFHHYQREHVAFMRMGADTFTIEADFSDGVTIQFKKYRVGKSSYSVFENGEEIFTTVQNGVFTRVTQVPQEVKDYLSFLEDDKISLHYRSSQDPLLLVNTSGSENYSFLSSIMQLDELMKALELGKRDVSAAKSLISKTQVELDVYTSTIDSKSIYTNELVRKLGLKVDANEVDENKQSRLLAINKDVKLSQEMVVVDEVSLLDITRLDALEFIRDNHESLSSLKVPVEVEGLALTRLDAIENLWNLKNSYDDAIKDVVVELPVYDKDLVKLEKLYSLESGLETLKSSVKVVNDLELEGSQIQEELKALSGNLKASGIEFYECEDCGTLNFVGEGVVHEH